MSPGARCGSSVREVYIIPAPNARAGHQKMHSQPFAPALSHAAGAARAREHDEDPAAYLQLQAYIVSQGFSKLCTYVLDLEF